MRRINTGVACGAALLAAGTALGQPAGIAQVPGVNAPAPAEGQMPPAPAEAMAAFTLLNGWVRAMAVTPAGMPDPVATAASVTLRSGGEVVGRGVAVSRRAEGEAGLVAAAAQAAIAEARSHLPVAHDALYEESLKAAAQNITVTLELSGVMVPFAPKDWGAATLGVAPGLEGVAVRVGERLEVMFPERMLTTATEAGAALPAMAAKLLSDPGAGLKGPGELGKEHGAVCYRFRVTQLAQTRPGGGPEFLERCGTFVATREIDTRSLEAWARGMADNLWVRRWTGNERYGLRGAYDPVRGEYAEHAAAPVEQALAMEALLRFAGHISKTSPAAQEIRTRVIALAEDLAVVEAGESPAPSDPGAAAVTWSVLDRLSRDGALSEPLGALRDACQAATDAAWAKADAMPAPTLLLMLRFAPPSPVMTDGARQFRARELLVKLGPAQLPAGMPWLGELSPGAAETLSGAWGGLRDLVSANMLRPEWVPPDQRDLAGGVLLGPGLPSWQSARPLTFLGELLSDQRLTDAAGLGPNLSRQVEGLRFLRQLSADDGETRMYADPASARWGVRNSVWDQRMPPEATALTLIAVTETLDSLDRLTERSRTGRAQPK